MSTIPFTDRELKRAWRELSVAAITSNNLRTNPQRLLLFYAVECGLKAAWLKRKRKTLFDDADIDEIGHDLVGPAKFTQAFWRSQDFDRWKWFASSCRKGNALAPA